LLPPPLLNGDLDEPVDGLISADRARLLEESMSAAEQ